MLIGTSQKIRRSPAINLSINHLPIENVNCIKHLGVYIDHNLTWNNHISHLCNKLNSSIFLLSRTRYFLNFQTALLLYNSLFLPHVDYCITVWGSRPSHISKIQKLQNRALRTILQVPYTTPTTQLFNTISTLSVSQRADFQTGCLAYRASNNLAPANICRRLARITANGRMSTRQFSRGENLSFQDRNANFFNILLIIKDLNILTLLMFP